MPPRPQEWYLLGLINGDSQAIEELMDACYPQVRRFVMKNSGTEEDAEDVFMETIEGILNEGRDKSITLTSKFSTYVFGICKNKWLNVLRKRKSYREKVTMLARELSTQGTVDPFEAMGEDDIETLVKNQFARLPEDCRRLLYLNFHTGDSQKKIAEQMGFTYPYVRKRKSDCLKKLRKLIDEALERWR